VARRAKSANPRIGLALSGGGARGYGHIPVLEAFDELGVRPTAIAGCSMGALIGAGYASGMSAHDIAAHVIDVFRSRSSVMARLWDLRPRSMREIISRVASIGQLDAERVLAAVLPGPLPKRFEDLAIPLCVTATDFYGWTEALLDEGHLLQAVAASAAVPFVFRPVMIGERVMIDGSISNPLPFDHIADACDILVAVDVVGGPIDSKGRPPGPAEAVFGSTQIFMQSITREKLRALPGPQVFVRPPTGAFRSIDFTKAAGIITASQPAKDEVKQKLGHAIQTFERSRG
jgi:NTE family protein